MRTVRAFMYRIYEIRKGGAAMELPAAFEKRMQDMLGAEYTAFRASYNEPHKRGIRLNTVKCTKEQLERALPFTLVQTPFSPLSFYAPTDTKMAALPLYHAGAACTRLQEGSTTDFQPLTPADLMSLGLTGGVNSATLRQGVLKALDLPENLTTKMLLRWVTSEEKKAQLLAAVEKIKNGA